MDLRTRSLTFVACLAIVSAIGGCSGARSKGLLREIGVATRDAEPPPDVPPTEISNEPDAVAEPDLDGAAEGLPERDSGPDAALPEANVDAAVDAGVMTQSDASDAAALDAAALLDASDADAAPMDAGDAAIAVLGDAACPHVACVPPGLLGGDVFYSRLADAGATNGEIWLHNAEPSKITDGEWPRVSSDGHLLLFHRDQASISRGNVYRRDLRTGAETLFFANNDYAVSYDFSASNQVIFDYYCEIDTANSDGTNRTVLFNAGGCYTDAPSVSQGGNAIAYHSNDGLHRMTLAGQNAALVPNTAAGDSWPVWGEHDTQLIFSRPNAAKQGCDYLKIQPDGANPKVLGTVGYVAPNVCPALPAVTPDQTRIVVGGSVNCLPALHVFRIDGSGYEGPVCGSEGVSVDYVGAVFAPVL